MLLVAMTVGLKLRWIVFFASDSEYAVQIRFDRDSLAGILARLEKAVSDVIVKVLGILFKICLDYFVYICGVMTADFLLMIRKPR